MTFTAEHPTKENIQLVLRLWREENVHWEGNFREPIEGYTVRPRPVQQPNRPLWVGSGFFVQSVLLAAELGLPLILPSVIAPPSHFMPLVEKYRDTFQNQGHGGPVVGALSHTHCAKDLEAVHKRYAPRHAEYMDWVGQRFMPWGLEPVLPLGVRTPTVPAVDFEQAIQTGPVVAGGPQQVLDQLCEFKEVCGLQRQLFHVDHGALPQEDLFDSHELLATEVLPKLKES